jgi:adenine phosphoribosyltransferase
MSDRLKAAILDVPDFPKKGIVFKDITPILGEPELFRHAVEGLASPWRNANLRYVAGIEARGFIFAAAVARELGCGFIPIRKPGKLPRATHRQTYALEYGTDALEIHVDALAKGDRVLLVDDLLATGGTAAACLELLRRCGASVVGVSFLIELAFLEGRPTLGTTPVEALVTY